jgi:hypothetical protein
MKSPKAPFLVLGSRMRKTFKPFGKSSGGDPHSVLPAELSSDSVPQCRRYLESAEKSCALRRLQSQKRVQLESLSFEEVFRRFDPTTLFADDPAAKSYVF